MIELRDVTLRYGRKVILKNVSMSFKKNEIKAIVGPSGSGKSTIVKLMLGLIKPTEGKVFVDEVDITEMKEKELFPIRQKMGIVFQGNALFDSMSVYDNISFFLKENMRLPETEVFNRTIDQIKFSGLEGFERTLPEALSGGMKKRVAIARALIFKPTMVLFDEPTAGLDPLNSRKILDLVLRMKRDIQLGALIVTHIIDDVRHVADKVCVLYQQQIIFDDEASKFWKNDHSFIKSFLKNEEI